MTKSISSGRRNRRSQFMHSLAVCVLPLTLGLCAVATIALLSFKQDILLEAGPMVQNVTSNGFTAVWWQRKPGSPVLSVRDASGQTQKFPTRRIGNRCEAIVSGLSEAGGDYEYWTELDTQTWSEQSPRCVRTPNHTNKTFSFMAFGDSGSGKRRQYALAKTMERYEVDLILHVGDLVYREGQWEDYKKAFFRPYKHILSRTPLYPVLGNHAVLRDNGEMFRNTFSIPSNGPARVQTKRCYWFDWGHARVAGIDSTLSRRELHNYVAPWLRDVLLTPGPTWRFVFMHHPPGPGGGRDADQKIAEELVPVIEACGVDIVFSGHNHLYQRTFPLLASKVSPANGVIYITTGTGGKSLHAEQNTANPNIAHYNDEEYGFTWVNVQGARLELQQISEHDAVLDRLVLEKQLSKQ